MDKCIAFDMEDPKEALNHIKNNWSVITKYDNKDYEHNLYTWDDGYRVLGECKECNKYILLQCSEFHSFEDSDSLYKDYFPVSSPEEAEELNKKYNGYDIEKEFDKKWLAVTNSNCNWRNQTDNQPRCKNCGSVLSLCAPSGNVFFCNKCGKYYINPKDGTVGEETSSPYTRKNVLY